MTATESAIRVRVDPTNPGQFFACCGLLELAHRLCGQVEGWFEESSFLFCLRAPQDSSGTLGSLPAQIGRCSVTNAITEAQLRRRKELAALPQKERKGNPELDSEKKALDALWRGAPLQFHEPFSLRVDWFTDELTGGDAFKTWAGQQSVMDIACSLKTHFANNDWSAVRPEEWLLKSMYSDDLPFNFDSALGGVGGDVDVGFSFDPLRSIDATAMRTRIRPLVELGAFVGLQRFRPSATETGNGYRYSTWSEPLSPEIAFVAAHGAFPRSEMFEFQLLYRTKYLKSFLPAKPYTRR